MEKLGTFIHGIGASEALDSSGERIKVSGIDDSSMPLSGVFNFEHNSEHTAQIVGKVFISKKIYSEKDCSNIHQLHFFNKANKKPYLYIAGVLFDGFGHSGAIDLAAMYKFNDVVTSKDLKTVVGFSIEGSKLDKKDDTITRCIARKMTVTLTPCNKECISQLITDKDYMDELTNVNTKDDLKDIFLKCEEMNMDLSKAEDGKKPKLNSVIVPNQSKFKDKKPYTPQSKATAMGRDGKGVKDIKSGSMLPKTTGNVYSSNDLSANKLKVGDTIVHNKTARTGRSGASIYNDPDTFKTENKKYSAVLSNKMENKKPINKALTAGGGGGVPSTLVGGSALVKKSENYWDNYQKRDELVSFLTEKMPKLNKKEVLALAKTTVYKMETERESALAGLEI